LGEGGGGGGAAAAAAGAEAEDLVHLQDYLVYHPLLIHTEHHHGKSGKTMSQGFLQGVPQILFQHLPYLLDGEVFGSSKSDNLTLTTRLTWVAVRCQ